MSKFTIPVQRLGEGLWLQHLVDSGQLKTMRYHNGTITVQTKKPKTINAHNWEAHYPLTVDEVKALDA